MMLRPFWRYYGGKWRAAPHYPAPRYDVIVEPFAGAAGYSMRYPDRHVELFDASPYVVGVWSYLIRVSPREIQAIPEVEAIADLPVWVPQEDRRWAGKPTSST
jgi:site-specific DNA-adenine methylase